MGGPRSPVCLLPLPFRLRSCIQSLGRRSQLRRNSNARVLCERLREICRLRDRDGGGAAAGATITERWLTDGEFAALLGRVPLSEAVLRHLVEQLYPGISMTCMMMRPERNSWPS